VNKTFYAIYNSEEKKFLSIYEDGEGNEYYSLVDFEHIYDNAILSNKEYAEFKLKEAINIAGFSTRFQRTITNCMQFLRDAVIVEIQVEFNNTGV
jgi:hypothetical protein